MDINLIAPFNSTGYGYASVNILKTFVDLGHNVSFWPITAEERIVKEYSDYYLSTLYENTRRYNYTAPSLRIWHQHDMALMPGCGKRVGMTFFETELRDYEVYHLNSLDAVIVPCEGLKEFCLEAGVKRPVHVIPLGVDSEIFNPYVTSLKTQLNIKSDDFVFVNIGKWEIRKGHDLILDAFQKAFPNDENVKLIMCCSNPCLDQSDNETWENYYGNNNDKRIIVSKQRLESQKQVAQVIATADCGLFPSKAEAWNFEAIECLAMHKSLIITDYLGHQVYANDSNSYLLPITEKEPAIDGKWFYGTGNWAKVDIDKLVELMRLAKENKKPNVNDVATKFSWTKTVDKIIEVL